MTASAIIEGSGGARELLDDTVEPYLYSDETLLAFLNSGFTEVALRTRCLQDNYPSPACSVDVVAGTAGYTLTKEVMVVRAAHITGRRDPLHRVTAAMLDKACPEWVQEAREGTPEYILFDATTKSITLYPVPNAAATLKLRVWRIPDESEQLADLDGEPVIVLPDPFVMVDWVLHKAYMLKDSELYDPERAAAHLALFTERFGPRPDLQALMAWSTSPPGRRQMVVDY